MSDKKSLILLQFVISAVFTVALLYPNLYASFGIIDDHEIIVNLGSDNEMSFAELPSKLMESEAGFAKAGRSRYRPAYWMLYLTETAAWDGKPFLWYAFRLFLIGISIFIAWFLLSRFLGIIFGGISCLFLFTQIYWADVWARLGPAELYALFGLAVYCLCFYKLWAGRKDAWWVPLSLGAFVAFGSKENFLFLVPVTAALLFRQWKCKKLTLTAVSSAAFVVVSGFVIGGIVLYMLSRTGVDIYGNNVSPAERVGFRLFAFQNLKACIPLFASALLYAASKRLSWTTASGAFGYKTLFLVQLFLFALWISQFFFYSGLLPTHTRYDFPGMFIYGLSFLILIFMGYKAIGRSAAKGAALVVFASVIAVQASNGFFAIQEASFQNMRKTVFFADNTARIISSLKVDPGAPVIFESHTFGDIEPLVSLSRYLYSHDIQNTAAVYFEERVIPQDRSSFGGMLAGRIEEFEKGDKTVPVGRLRFTPYEHLPEGKCFVISFSGNATLNCVDLGRIW